MSYDENLAARIRSVLAERDDVVEKKMFGGLCFMVSGAMCCGPTKADFMVRVGPAQFDDALAEPHARPMDFTGRPLRGMVYVAPEGIRTDRALARWQRGLAFISENPPSGTGKVLPVSKRRPASIATPKVKQAVELNRVKSDPTKR